MCRLMAFVSDQLTDFPRLVGENFEEFVGLSSFHKDGWGIAINNAHENEILLVREPEAALASQAFALRVNELHGNGGLLHLRWATSGLENCEANTHPFTHGNSSFIHNGDIRPREKLDRYIDPELNRQRIGETDSERYFFLLLSEIKKYGVIAGVKSTVKVIETECTYSSINAMLLTPEELVLISQYNQVRIPAGQPDDYYQLRYKVSDAEILVASSGWNQSKWSEIKNRTLVVINRDTRKLDFHNLT